MSLNFQISTEKLNIDELSLRIDTYWIQYNAFTILFVTLGYTLVEMGFSRYKNWSFTVLKNLILLSSGALAWWLIGFAFAHGETSNNGIGATYFAENRMNTAQVYNQYMTSFALAMSSLFIASGVITERANPAAYIVWAFLYAGVSFPLGYHWAYYTTGWLKRLDFYDFSGAAVIHIAGAFAGLGALVVTKSRKNRFDDTFNASRPNEWNPTSTIHVAIGMIILWFSFSTRNNLNAVSMEAYDFSTSINLASLNYVLGSSASLITVLILSNVISDQKYKFTRCVNAILAGLIATAAGANSYLGWSGLIIGICAGLVYFAYSIINEKCFKLDDPLDAFSLHFGAGSMGLIALGFFHTKVGVFYGYKGYTLGANFLGLVIYAGFPFTFTCLLFLLFKLFGWLDQNEDQDSNGNDATKVGGVGFKLDRDTAKTHSDNIMESK